MIDEIWNLVASWPLNHRNYRPDPIYKVSGQWPIAGNNNMPWEWLNIQAITIHGKEKTSSLHTFINILYLWTCMLTPAPLWPWLLISVAHYRDTVNSLIWVHLKSASSERGTCIGLPLRREHIHHMEIVPREANYPNAIVMKRIGKPTAILAITYMG